jgi:hypothetical protein
MLEMHDSLFCIRRRHGHRPRRLRGLAPLGVEVVLVRAGLAAPEGGTSAAGVGPAPADVAVLGEVRVLPTELAAAAVRVDAARGVLRAARREVAGPAAHEARRERERVAAVDGHRALRERVLRRAAPVRRGA